MGFLVVKVAIIVVGTVAITLAVRWLFRDTEPATTSQSSNEGCHRTSTREEEDEFDQDGFRRIGCTRRSESNQNHQHGHMYNRPTRQNTDVFHHNRSRRQYDEVRFSNHRNNHDHDKRRYATRSEAESVIRSMQADPFCGGSDRLRSYYNEDLGAWFVGNSKYD